MPGRVFHSQVPEYRDDVASLDSSLFLRRVGHHTRLGTLTKKHRVASHRPTHATVTPCHPRQDGAEMAGVHASFGVPVVQGSTVFVLAFYSGRRGAGGREQAPIAPETLNYIRQATASWRIETTLSPTATSLTTFVSSAQATNGGGGMGMIGPPHRPPSASSSSGPGAGAGASRR